MSLQNLGPRIDAARTTNAELLALTGYRHQSIVYGRAAAGASLGPARSYPRDHIEDISSLKFSEPSEDQVCRPAMVLLKTG